MSGAQSGSVLHVRTIGGVGLVSLSSGPASGAILLEFTTDRSDNNVSNGIQDPVSSLMAVGVYDFLRSGAPIVTSDSVGAGKVGEPYAYALDAEGGVPPYSWSAPAGLPNGLTLSNTGVLQGIPSSAGTYNVVIAVRDIGGANSTRNLVINIAKAEAPTAPTTPTTPSFDPFFINGCTGSEPVCQLPDAPADVLYQYAFSAVGGDTSKAVTWDFTPSSPAWLTTSVVGNNGLVSGTPTTPVAAAQCLVKFTATATRGLVSVSRQVGIKVTGGGCP